MALAEALRSRRSHREFASPPLSREEVAQLCWAAQGITDDAQGYRTAPSAGALYPITVFVVDAAGVHEYEPREHALRRTRAGDLRRQLHTAALDQPCIGAAPVCLAITINEARTGARYGKRSERYCLLETGHVAQNVLLQATALGLAGVTIGAFDDRKVGTVLGLPPELRPVYLVPLGHPGGRNSLP